MLQWKMTSDNFIKEYIKISKKKWGWDERCLYKLCIYFIVEELSFLSDLEKLTQTTQSVCSIDVNVKINTFIHY